IRGGGRGGQKITLCTVDANKQFGQKVNVGDFVIGKTISAAKPDLCVIPLRALKATETRISGFCLQDATGGQQAPVYLASMRLTTSGSRPTPGSISLTVDATRE